MFLKNHCFVLCSCVSVVSLSSVVGGLWVWGVEWLLLFLSSFAPSFPVPLCASLSSFLCTSASPPETATGRGRSSSPPLSSRSVRSSSPAPRFPGRSPGTISITVLPCECFDANSTKAVGPFSSEKMFCATPTTCATKKTSKRRHVDLLAINQVTLDTVPFLRLKVLDFLIIGWIYMYFYWGIRVESWRNWRLLCADVQACLCACVWSTEHRLTSCRSTG